MPPLSVSFAGASTGRWSIERLDTVAGSPLAPASRLEVLEGPHAARPAADSVWMLRGVTSNEPLGRARATRAALIPVKKSEAWWDLAHNQYRRAIERHWLVAE